MLNEIQICDKVGKSKGKVKRRQAEENPGKQEGKKKPEKKTVIKFYGEPLNFSDENYAIMCAYICLKFLNFCARSLMVGERESECDKYEQTNYFGVRMRITR